MPGEGEITGQQWSSTLDSSAPASPLSKRRSAHCYASWAFDQEARVVTIQAQQTNVTSSVAKRPRNQFLVMPWLRGATTANTTMMTASNTLLQPVVGRYRI